MAQSLLVFPHDKKWSQPMDYCLKSDEFVVRSTVFIEFGAMKRSQLEILGAKAYYHDVGEDGVCDCI